MCEANMRHMCETCMCLQQMYETAAPFFELAAQVQPQEVKWHLMVASCVRRTGNQQQASTKGPPLGLLIVAVIACDWLLFAQWLLC